LVSLEAAFAEFLRVQRGQGFSAGDLDRLLSRWTDRSSEPGIVVVEPEPALRRLIAVELVDQLPDVRVTAASCCSARRSPEALSGRCVVVRHEVAARLQNLDPAVADLVIFRTASIRECRCALRVLRTGQVVTLLTSSRLLRGYFRELFAGELGERVGLVCPKPWNGPELDRALSIADLILTDLRFTLPRRPSGRRFLVRAFRIIDRGWIRELARYIGVAPRPRKTWPQAELERSRGIG
jgi:hypothetical protein